jgi:L-asparaginase
MRTADDPDWDGPRNLRDAVRVAASPEAHGLGSVVVMAGRILPGDDVVKVHTTRDEAFAAPNAGRLGSVDDGGVRMERPRGPWRRIGQIPAAAAEPVFLVTATVGMDGSMVRALATLRPAGVVIAATGAGNSHPDLLAACRELMADGVPVVITTRCVSGGAAPAYGFPGGGATWFASGAMSCGTLSGPKARVALALALGARLSGERLRTVLAGPEAVAGT